MNSINEKAISPSEVSSARIATTAQPRHPWYVRLILAAQRRKYGAALEPARLWARMPRSFLLLTLLYRTIDRADSPIEPGLRALVQVQISRVNWCGFCVDLNSAAAFERAVSAEKLAALDDYERSPLFTERERAALAYAEAATDSARGVDDPCFTRLRGQFDAQTVLELTALVSFQNLSSKFNAALGVPAQGFCATRVAKEPGQ